MAKAAYKQRVRYICETQKARRVAANMARDFRRVCEEVVQKGGARARA